MINAIKAVKAPRTVALRMPMLAVSGVLAGLFMTSHIHRRGAPMAGVYPRGMGAVFAGA